ncbi:diguanylate cyclase/phosphodiesterase [Breoghania corrubedonensis]|uniref:Diguanylate cyclase/phosphodiesterase n=1 Tax=Breoghania corrubedonensis TaxID=665038 RepID=A0A2T5VEM9_9HYPH|nr:EAL domain-containing protein [Breoghania corrubedonensis]PTW62214.1 diguanylate cyclase/phosphodiesterase [Breoghania corrubedonensis]
MLRFKRYFYVVRFASRALRDAIVLVIVSIPLLIAAAYFDLFDLLFWYTRTHEAWQLDELLSAGFVVGLAAVIYAARRVADLRTEIRLRRAAESAVVRLTLHDALTGLPNRYKFERLFAAAIREVAESPRAVMVLKVDAFNHVNDTYGHAVGDNLLLAVAGRLEMAIGAEGVVARIGANEFALVTKPLQHEIDISRLVQHLILTMEDPFRVLGNEVMISVSIGVARYPLDGRTSPQLLRRADVARRKQKGKGRSHYALFEERMERAITDFARMESALRTAISQDRIVPYFQPIQDLETGRTIAFECLARWNDPELGWVRPDRFISLAEESGQIGRLSDRLLRKACAAARGWPKDISLSFNISGLQLRERSLGLDILSVLGELGFNPARLELEITETALVRDVPVARESLDILSSTGVRVALDDFGTGHSSLRYICDFPIHKLKIDQSFVRTMCKRFESEQIISAVLGLAHGMGITATAEGIEDEAQMLALKRLGCDFGQGYLIGRPMPAEAVAGYLQGQAEYQRQRLSA